MMLLFASMAGAQSTYTLNIDLNLFIHKMIEVSGNKFVSLGSNNANGQFVITQWDQNFSPQWSLSAPIQDIGAIVDVIELNDGNYALLTMTNSFNTANVLKLSVTGQILFFKRYGFSTGGLTAFGFAPAPLGDNGYIFGGGQCAYNNYLTKCKANGDVDWSYSFFDSTLSGGLSALSIVTNVDGYTIASQLTSMGETEAALWRIDSLGNQRWGKWMQHTSGQESPKKLFKKDDGALLLLCAEDLIGGDDFLLFADSNCSNVSLKSYHGPVDFSFADCLLDSANKVVVVGLSTDSGFGDKTFCMQTDALGQPEWQKLTKVTSDASNSQSSDIVPTPSGHHAISAMSPAVNQFGTITVIDGQGNGFCVEDTISVMATLEDSVSLFPLNFVLLPAHATVTDISISPTPFGFSPVLRCGNLLAAPSPLEYSKTTIVPNPSHGKAVLSNPNGFKRATATLYSVEGKMVGQVENISGFQCPLEFAAVPKGMYLLRITHGRHHETLKWIVE
jgi:hypothetical protein